MSRFTHGCPLRNCTANCEYSFFVKEIIGVFVLMESEELVVALRSNEKSAKHNSNPTKRDSFK